MAEATLSSKNQIVIPREAREALGVQPGDKLLVVVRGKTVISPSTSPLMDQSAARFGH
jgi:AbrB family looped-hinge helix DNA binding protein